MSHDIYICSVYVPPQNSSRELRTNIDHFECLQEKIYKFGTLAKSFYVEILTQERGHLIILLTTNFLKTIFKFRLQSKNDTQKIHTLIIMEDHY